MSKRRKKRDPHLLLRWTAALLLAGLTVWLLVRCLAPAPRPTGEAVPGIDVSSHQGHIRWQEVADSGIQFAMIRLGYRGYDDGALHVDEKAKENLTAARAAGLKIGAYFFSQALTEAEAREEAALALQVLDGMALDLPLSYDWEHVSPDARTGAMAPEALTACVHAFCEDVAAAGYEPMIYFNHDLSQTLLDLDAVDRYPFWFARYAEEADFHRPMRMWQWTDQGTVPGIDEKTDLDWLWPWTPGGEI